MDLDQKRLLIQPLQAVFSTLDSSFEPAKLVLSLWEKDDTGDGDIFDSTLRSILDHGMTDLNKAQLAIDFLKYVELKTHKTDSISQSIVATMYPNQSPDEARAQLEERLVKWQVARYTLKNMK